MFLSWGRGDLRTVGPISLVAVILLGVVRRRNDDDRMAFQLADGEAQLGRGAQRVEEEDVEVVRSEDVGDALGEHARIVAAVVGDGDADALAGEVLFEVVGQTLRSGAHGVDVHAVGTYAHDAAQAARTELEILVKTLDEFFHVILH